MPRTARAAPPGFVYHVLNRAVARLPLFQADYDAFERVLAEALTTHPTPLLGYCLTPITGTWSFDRSGAANSHLDIQP